MTEPTHSPLPWHLIESPYVETQDKIFDANDDFVAHINGAGVLVDEHNARLIVAAVNGRAELLAAAERASIVLCKLMEASIAKAEEREP